MAAAVDRGLMVRKRLAIAVDGTVSMAPTWPTIVDDIIKKIVREFNTCGASTSQGPPCTVNEFGVIMFTTHGPHSPCLVQASGWTRNVEIFHEWLAGLSFLGGGHYESAIAEGLAETLVMLPKKAHGTADELFNEEQKHCILVAGSKPFPLVTPVFVPKIIKSPTGDYPSEQIENVLADAEQVARLFIQCSVSLSVLSAKRFPNLKEVFIAANPDASEADISFRSEKHPAFLILLSRKFPEACAAIYGPGAADSSLVSAMGNNTGTPLVHDETEFDLDLPEEDILFLRKIFCDPLDQKNTSAACNSGLVGMANPDASKVDISFRSEKHPSVLILRFPEACAATYGPEAANSSLVSAMGNKMGTPLIHDDTEFHLDLPEEDIFFLQKIFCDPLGQKDTSAECNSGLIGMELETAFSSQSQPAFPNPPHDSLPDFDAALPSPTLEEILGYNGTQNALVEMEASTYQQEKVISCSANTGNTYQQAGSTYPQVQVMSSMFKTGDTYQQGPVLSSLTNGANTYQLGRGTRSISNTRKYCGRKQRAVGKRPRTENSMPLAGIVSQALDTAQNSSNSLLMSKIPTLSGNFNNLQMSGNLGATETAIASPFIPIFETSQISEVQTRLSGRKGPFHPQSSIIGQPKALSVNLQGSPNKTISSSSAASLVPQNIMPPQLSACLQKDLGFDYYMQPRGNTLQLSGQNVRRAGFSNQTISGGFFGQSSFSSSASTLNPAAEGPNNTAREVNFTLMSNNLNQSQLQRNKYITAWEGSLAANFGGRFVLVTRLVSYRKTSTPEKITSDWPRTLQLGRLLCRKFFSDFLYHDEEEYLVFEAKHIHPIFEQLRTKHFCVTVKLPSQTMIIVPTDRDGRFIGTIFPGHFPLLGPRIPSRTGAAAQRGTTGNKPTVENQGQGNPFNSVASGI